MVGVADVPLGRVADDGRAEHELSTTPPNTRGRPRALFFPNSRAQKGTLSLSLFARD